MKETKLLELQGALREAAGNLERLYATIGEALQNEVKILGRTGNSALIAAGLIESYYTCLETLLLRISQLFENSLSSGRWHSDLLEKMTREVPGVRIAAISPGAYSHLLEILKFRHFRRYYFQIEYDWDKIDFVIKKLQAAHPVVLQDLQRFDGFLGRI